MKILQNEMGRQTSGYLGRHPQNGHGR